MNKSMLNEEMMVSTKDGQLVVMSKEEFKSQLGLNKKSKYIASFISMVNNTKENVIDFIQAHKERCLRNGITITPVRYQLSRTIDIAR